MGCHVQQGSIASQKLTGFLTLGIAFFIFGCGFKEPQQSQQQKATVIETKLLKDRMALYDKLSEHFEKAATLEQLKKDTAIPALNQELAKVTEEYNVRPDEARETAEEALKQQWDETQARYLKAKTIKRK